MSNLFNYLYKKNINDKPDLLCGSAWCNMVMHNIILPSVLRLYRGVSVVYDIDIITHIDNKGLLKNSPVSSRNMDIIYKNKRIRVRHICLNNKRYNTYNITYNKYKPLRLMNLILLRELHIYPNKICFKTSDGEFCPYELRNALIMEKDMAEMDYDDDGVYDDDIKEILLYELLSNMYG